MGGNRVGGTDLYEGNIIVGNDIGMLVSSPGNQILNNRIGTDFGGAALPNRIGVILGYTSNGTILGSGWYGAGNIIAFNTEDGVLASTAEQAVIEQNTIHHNGGDGIGFETESDVPADGMKITIRRNSIYDNGGLGINIPVPSFAHNLTAPENLRYRSGTVTGTACPGCIVDLFKAAADPSGAGEGKTFLESADASGDGSFSIATGALPACTQITATATDSLGNTSMFSTNANTSLCFRLTPLLSWVVVLGGAGAGAGAALLILVRRRPLTLRRAPWLLLGAALGFGAAVLLLCLPFVQILWPSPQSGQPQITARTPAIFSETAPAFTQGPPMFTPTVTIAAAPTATGTQSVPTATLRQTSYCRTGPSTDYHSITNLPQGSTVAVVGRNQDGSWWQVQVPGTQTRCWVAGGNVETSGNLSQVPIVEAPPLGCWVKPQQGPEQCIAPCPEGAKPGGACEP
jgi:hypothetical protein